MVHVLLFSSITALLLIAFVVTLIVLLVHCPNRCKNCHSSESLFPKIDSSESEIDQVSFKRKTPKQRYKNKIEIETCKKCSKLCKCGCQKGKKCKCKNNCNNQKLDIFLDIPETIYPDQKINPSQKQFDSTPFKAVGAVLGTFCNDNSNCYYYKLPMKNGEIYQPVGGLHAILFGHGAAILPNSYDWFITYMVEYLGFVVIAPAAQIAALTLPDELKFIEIGKKVIERIYNGNDELNPSILSNKWVISGHSIGGVLASVFPNPKYWPSNVPSVFNEKPFTIVCSIPIVMTDFFNSIDDDLSFINRPPTMFLEVSCDCVDIFPLTSFPASYYNILEENQETYNIDVTYTVQIDSYTELLTTFYSSHCGFCDSGDSGAILCKANEKIGFCPLVCRNLFLDNLMKPDCQHSISLIICVLFIAFSFQEKNSIDREQAKKSLDTILGLVSERETIEGTKIKVNDTLNIKTNGRRSS